MVCARPWICADDHSSGGLQCRYNLAPSIQQDWFMVGTAPLAVSLALGHVGKLEPHHA
jgi:hypothetical protein